MCILNYQAEHEKRPILLQSAFTPLRKAQHWIESRYRSDPIHAAACHVTCLSILTLLSDENLNASVDNSVLMLRLGHNLPEKQMCDNAAGLGGTEGE